MPRRLFLYAIYVAFLVFIVTPSAIVAIDYVFWLRYVGELEGIRKPQADELLPPNNVARETLGRLGSIYNLQHSWFGNFPLQKKEGIIRIGAFGDSFTHGDETDASGDFPNQLAALLKAAGVTNVEVLNFGNSWYGFDQTYVMWDEVGRKYDLDYILLGPMTFFSDRDTRFNHAGKQNPYYLHSRFVLDGETVRRIDVAGETYSERFRQYHGFIPRSRYLRYDRSDPAFLAALLPEGRTFGNPFYYDSEPERTEATEIYRRLLESMKRTDTPIILGLYFWFNDLWQATADLGDRRFCAAEFERPAHFPYIAPGGHDAPTGNLFLAYQYLSALLGRPVAAPVMLTADLDDAPDPAAPGLASLSAYDKVRITIAGKEAGRFTLFGQSPGTQQSNSQNFLKDGGFNALIALKAPGRSVLDGLLLALPAVDPTAPVRLVFRSSTGEWTARPSGQRKLAKGLSSVDIPGISSVADPDLVDVRELTATFGRELPVGSLQVLLGDQVVLEGANSFKGEGIRLHPVQGRTYVVRGSPSGIPAASEVGSSGSVDLELVQGADVTRVPIARWFVDTWPVAPSLMCPDFRAPLSTVAGIRHLKDPASYVNISITASADDFEGPPQMRVRWNDRFMGDYLVRAPHSADRWDEVSLRVPAKPGPGKLSIEFLNDNWDPTTLKDRNLWIREVEVSARNLQPEEGFFLDAASGEKKAGGPELAVKGALIFPDL